MAKERRTLYLLRCPRCNGSASLFAQRLARHGTEYAIACTDRTCGVNTTFMRKMPEEMADRWNDGIGLTRGGVPYRQRPGQMMALEVRV